MDFEEKILTNLIDQAQKRKQDFIQQYGNPSEMSLSNKKFYNLNFSNTTKKAIISFYDRINCGGYSFEVDSFLSPDERYDYNSFISAILNSFDFVRLLGDTPLTSDEYLVFGRFANEGTKFAHHFIKVNDDGLVVEKMSIGKPLIFTQWPVRYMDCSDVAFAVQKSHEHYFDSSKELLDYSHGLDFKQSVQEAIENKSNEFSYHSHSYRLKRAPDGGIVVVNPNLDVVVDVFMNDNDISLNVAEGQSDYIDNYSGFIKPVIKNGRLINLDEYRGVSRQPLDREQIGKQK